MNSAGQITDVYSGADQTVPSEVLFADSGEFAASAPKLFADSHELFTTSYPAESPRLLDIQPLVNNYFFIIAIIVLFIGFCYLIYNYRHSLVELFTEGQKDKILNEQSLVFRRLLTYGLIVSLLLYALVLVKAIDISGADPVTDNHGPWWLYDMAVPVMFAALLVYLIYRKVINSLISRVTSGENVLGQYRLLSRIALLTGAFFLTPLFFLLVMGSRTDNMLFIWVISGVAAVMYLIYLGRSLKFFRQKNVSIFHWFLYLCAVEFLPLSFVLVSALRYSS